MIHLMIGFLMFCACLWVAIRFWRPLLCVAGALGVLLLVMWGLAANAGHQEAQAKAAAEVVRLANRTPAEIAIDKRMADFLYRTTH